MESVAVVESHLVALELPADLNAGLEPDPSYHQETLAFVPRQTATASLTRPRQYTRLVK